MNEALIEQVAGRLNIEPEKVESALNDFVSRAEQDLKEKGEVHLEGLGVLRHDQGQISFEPDAALALAVNRRFAGLETVTFDVPEGGRHYQKQQVFIAPPPPALEEPPAAAETGSLFEATTGQDVPQPADGEPEGVLEEPYANQEPPIEFLEEEDGIRPEQGEEEKLEEDIPELITGAELDQEPDEADAPSREDDATPFLVKEPVALGGDAEDSPRRRSTPVWWLALAAVAFIGLSLLAWNILIQRQPEPPAQVEAPPPASPPPAEPEGEITAADPPVVDTPLRSGAGIAAEQGGFTWVVASRSNRDEAEAIVQQYRERGFRSDVLPGTAQGRAVYRVGVGQFSSSSEAQAARDELPEDAPADTWLFRIP